MSHRHLPLVVFALALVGLALVSGSRLKRTSRDSHFVVQAAAWLDGRIDIPDWPAGADDPARVEDVELDDGRVVRGRRIGSRNSFRTTAGEEISLARVKRTVKTEFYNSFPPFPSVLLLPQVALAGKKANDVWFTVVLAAAVPALLLVLLRRLRALGLSTRSPADELWLSAMLVFGTVFLFCAVQGRVWFTAHVVGVVLAILYALCSLGAQKPALAGLALGLAFATRTPMLFAAPFFLFELWRTRDATDLRPTIKKLLLFAAPIAVIGLACAWYNLVRFGSPTEFGHSYLAVRQQAQIERYGLFNLHYLGRNLAVAFTLLPDLTLRPPYVSISGHGLALWFTTPALLYVLWPAEKGPLHRALWVTVACVAVPTLLYQNSGWFQFGYRFALDYMVFLILLLAVGGRPFTRVFRALVIAGIAVNLFGALTFDRAPRFYRTDGNAYQTIVAH